MNLAKQDIVWIDIKGYKGLYQITDKPTVAVRRVDAIVKNRGSINMFRKGGMLKPHYDNFGYLFFGFSKGGIHKNHRRGRLVGLHFVKGRSKLKNQINHKNGIKIDDRPCNLEWCTPSENLHHAFDTGLKKRYFGANHHNSVPITAKNLVTGEIKIFAGINEASRYFEMKVPRIWNNLQRGGITKNNLMFSYNH